ncbi:hypothetical protein [Hymenobacter actinosclerus]|uniref:hypothetical protein n=1 Tax=Hymenobacter actinosclerus TaxID=82805 RepID=UPI0011603091|nr:hypothetical protein [Hymenobacter actinosclerus]
MSINQEALDALNNSPDKKAIAAQHPKGPVVVISSEPGYCSEKIFPITNKAFDQLKGLGEAPTEEISKELNEAMRGDKIDNIVAGTIPEKNI